ncbi:MAG: 50S ribosomal protein L25 [Dehalococcoidia bacterium]
MADVQLEVDPRVVTGKKVKGLRRQGLLPAHLYGRDTESPTPTITNLLKTAGRNAIIDLKINGEGEARPVVLRGVQRDPITDELVHIDFFQISLTEKLRADVPIVLVGESSAVTVFGGVLLHSLDHLTIEALPADIPRQIEVDISILEELESALFVRDLVVPPDIEVYMAPDQVVVKVSAPKIAAEIEAEEAAAAEEAALAAEGEEPVVEGEAEEGAAAPAKAEEESP